MENTTLEVTLQGYKDKIKELKTELNALKIGSEDYKRVVSELNKVQTEYSQVLTDVKRGGDSAANSMNALKDQLKEMKSRAFRMDSKSEEFKELSASILATTNRLKELEMEQGTFSRNVGNYAGGIVEAFKLMGVEMGGAQKAVVGMTQASTGLKDVMTAISKHPLLTLVMVIVTVLMKIKSAIDSNEQATEALQRGMSAFQPVLNLVNKAFGFLAESVANAVDWLGQKMPKGLSVLGDAISFGNKAVGWLLEGIVNFATFAPRIWLNAFAKMIEGVGWLSDKLADFVDFLGMDGSVLRGMTDGLEKFINDVYGASHAVGYLGKKVKSLIDSGSDPIVNMFKKWANATETVYKNTQKQQQLDHEIRQQSIESAKSEARQAELQRKIAQSTGEEKLKYMRELKKEIEDNGAREKRIAEETLKLAKERASWAPNSKEENDYLAELEANAIKVEASVNASLAGIEKRETKLEESIKSSAEKTAKEITAQHEKEEKKRLEISEQSFKKWQGKLEELQNSYSIKYDEIATEEEQLKGAGLLSYAQLNDYETRKFEIIKNKNKELSRMYAEMVTDAELDEMKKLEIQKKYQALQLQAAIEFSKFQQLIEKNKEEEIADNVKKYRTETAKDIAKLEHEKSLKNFANEYGNVISELIQLRGKYKRDNEDFSKELDGQLSNDIQKLTDKYTELYQNVEGLSRLNIKSYTGMEEELLLDAENIRHEYAVRELDSIHKHLEEIKTKLGESSEEYLALQQEYNQKILDESIAHAEKLVQIDEKRVARQQKTEQQALQESQRIWNLRVRTTMQAMQSTASIFGSLANIYEMDIQRQYDNEEISEEVARERFAKVKAFETAEAIINTISMGLNAQLSVWKEPGLPLFAKIPMSALLLTETALSGYAQVKQIQSTEFGSTSTSGSSGSSGGSSISSVAVSPLLNYETDVDNATSLTDGQVSGGVNRVVIVQQDIVDTLNQDRVRTSQSTF